MTRMPGVKPVDVAVVGRGLTGVFVASRLREAGLDAALIGQPRPPALAPARVGDESITLVPILPPHRMDSFPPHEPTDAQLQVRYVGEPSSRDPQFAAARGSLAEFHNGNPVGLVLSQKQYGARVWSEPLLEVQEKISRSYLKGPTAGRSAYRDDGTSPYWPAFSSALRELRTFDFDVAEWKLATRELILQSGETVAYERAIVTVPLDHVSGLLGFDFERPILGPASFAAMVTAGHEPQQMVYDLEPLSPVIRIFTPTSRTVVAQLSLSGRFGQKEGEDLAERVRDLVGTEVVKTVISNFTQALAYPLEPLARSAQEMIEGEFAAMGVTFFGRYATQRYLDLHELPWGEVCI